MSRLATGVVADLLASTQIRLIMAVVGVVRFRGSSSTGENLTLPSPRRRLTCRAPHLCGSQSKISLEMVSTILLSFVLIGNVCYVPAAAKRARKCPDSAILESQAPGPADIIGLAA
jgi:hypothetical protein